MRRHLTAFLALTAVLAGCGGDSHDFSAAPASYRPVLVSPDGATSLALASVSRDGRLLGSYTKANVAKFFGWSPDGKTKDLTPPTQCKQLDAIDEVGDVVCSDRSASPTKLYYWTSERVRALALPAAATDAVVAQMTFNGIGATLTTPNGTQGFRLDPDEDPKSVTVEGGTVRAVSLSGLLACTEPVAGDVKALVVNGSDKGPLVGDDGTDTVPTGVTDSGVMAANRGRGAGPYQALRISGTQQTVLPLPAGATETKAWDVGGSGVIVGSALFGAEWKAVAWFPVGGVKVLASLTTLPTGVALTDAVRVTPLGVVVCTGTKTDGNTTVPVVFALKPDY